MGTIIKYLSIVYISFCFIKLQEVNGVIDRLNVELIHQILSIVNPIDWFQCSYVNHEFRDVSINLFNETYGRHSIVIRGPWFENPDESLIDTENNGLLFVRSYEAATHILNVFGTVVYKLNINFENIAINQANQICRLIARNCSQSLTTLAIINFNENAFEIMHFAQFPNLEKMLITGQLINIPENFVLMFPYIRQLYIDCYIGNQQNIVHQFSSLIYVHFNLNQNRIDPINVLAFVNNNPNLKGASFQSPSREFLLALSYNEPSLEELLVDINIPDAFEHGDQINFPNMKHLSIHHSFPINFIPFILNPNRLKELIINSRLFSGIGMTNIWVTFITRHFKLQRLTFENHVIDVENMATIVNHLPELRRLTFTTTVDDDYIIQLLGLIPPIRFIIIPTNPLSNLQNRASEFYLKWNLQIVGNGLTVFKGINNN